MLKVASGPWRNRAAYFSLSGRLSASCAQTCREVRLRIVRGDPLCQISLTAIAVCVAIFVNSEALALANTTTESCLKRKLCAYVDTKGHVTCGPCPGQARAVLANLAVASQSKITMKTCASKWDSMTASHIAKTTRADYTAACFYKASAMKACRRAAATAR
jgi:hypothetical protein